MNEETDINRFVKDPNLLVDLCQKVINQIDNSPEDPKDGEKEAQLREISRSIERLEKAGVAIPDALRAEKTRLAADLSIKAGASMALNLLTDEMEKILNELKGRLNRGARSPGLRKTRGKRSNLPKTSRKVLREEIIRALKTLGGRARSVDVIAQVGQQLKGKLLPGDMEWRKSANAYAWQHNVHWERYRMTKEGLLRKDSERGYWELNDNY